MQWYYVRDNQRQGPISEAEFQSLVTSGVIQADTLVWRQGMSEWQPYAKVFPGAATAANGDDTEVCAVSGKRYPKREMIQYEGKWISAEHRDKFFQQLREGVVAPVIGGLPGPYGYGGFWLRAGGFIIDRIILWVLTIPIGMLFSVFMGAGAVNSARFNIARMLAAEAVMLGLIFAINLGYEIFFIRKFDATPGKMAVGVKVFRTDGSKLSVMRIVGRLFAKGISGLILCIGYIMAGVDEEKRALHDRMCDTRVVRVR